MHIVDSHCHLNDERLMSLGLDAVMNKAFAADVKSMLTICTQDADFEEIYNIAKKYPHVYCSYGIHPHEAGKEHIGIQTLLEKGQRTRVIGLGETGLDYYYENAPKAAQMKSFAMHLEAAHKLDLPVIIHSRDADDDMIAMLTEALTKHPLKLLFHCFSSSRKLMEFGVEKGCFFSASGIMTFKKSSELRAMFADIPTNLLLVETDSPYLAPEPHRGKTNEPAYTAEVLTKLAEVKDLPIEEMAKITTDNFFRLFSRATQR